MEVANNDVSVPFLLNKESLKATEIQNPKNYYYC